MIPESGNLFSGKIMLEQRIRFGRAHLRTSRSLDGEKLGEVYVSYDGMVYQSAEPPISIC